MVDERSQARTGWLGISVVALVVVLLLAGCGSGVRHAGRWDGRRGYDGNGDYGYDLASRAEAREYHRHAEVAYAVPGPPEDPWGPHIREAAGRFGVPEHWIREVMRQETGGRLYDAEGLPITSRAGAMGLMQVMPRTYDTLQARYGLGSDPYEPRDNILAGTAYIREMHDRFGAPGFLAAYNAGPDRVEAVLAGAMILPEETVNYVASVGPRLGFARTLDSPFTDDAAALTRFGRLAPPVSASTGDDTLAYAGGGLVAGPHVDARLGADDDGDPLSRAFDGGGLVTPDAPTGTLNAFPRHGAARSRLGLPGWRSR